MIFSQVYNCLNFETIVNEKSRINTMVYYLIKQIIPSNFISTNSSLVLQISKHDNNPRKL